MKMSSICTRRRHRAFQHSAEDRVKLTVWQLARIVYKHCEESVGEESCQFIRCAAFNEAAVAFYEMIRVGKIYKISKADVNVIRDEVC